MRHQPAEATAMLTLPTLADAPGIIPDPAAVRQMIGFRQTELSILRRLLKVAEDNARVKRGAATVAAPSLIPTPLAAQVPTHAG